MSPSRHCFRFNRFTASGSGMPMAVLTSAEVGDAAIAQILPDHHPKSDRLELVRSAGPTLLRRELGRPWWRWWRWLIRK